MFDIILKYTPLQTLGYVTCNVPPDVMSEVFTEINEFIKTNYINARKANSVLVGNIQKEFLLTSSVNILNKFFESVMPGYWEAVGEIKYAREKYIINPAEYPWVNLQKKYEMNPPHMHSGVLSFVLYINIPYSIEEEKKLPLYNRGGNEKLLETSGPAFKFLFPSAINNNYMTVLGQTASAPIREHSINVDKSWEGKMLIFPAYLPHMVTPFYTSDELRISVSGNLIPETLLDNFC